MESDSKKTETIVRLELLCEGSPAESVQEVTRLIEQLHDKFKLLRVNIDSFDEDIVKEVLKTTKQLLAKHDNLSERKGKEGFFREKIPALDEE